MKIIVRREANLTNITKSSYLTAEDQQENKEKVYNNKKINAVNLLSIMSIYIYDIICLLLTNNK